MKIRAGYLVISFSFLVTNLLVATFVLLNRKSLPPVVPLFFGKARGEEQLANSITLALPSLVASAICALNTLLIRINKDDSLKKIILFLTFIVTFLATVTVLKIFFLVGRI